MAEMSASARLIFRLTLSRPRLLIALGQRGSVSAAAFECLASTVSIQSVVRGVLVSTPFMERDQVDPTCLRVVPPNTKRIDDIVKVRRGDVPPVTLVIGERQSLKAWIESITARAPKVIGGSRTHLAAQSAQPLRKRSLVRTACTVQVVGQSRNEAGSGRTSEEAQMASRMAPTDSIMAAAAT